MHSSKILSYTSDEVGLSRSFVPPSAVATSSSIGFGAVTPVVSADTAEIVSVLEAFVFTALDFLSCLFDCVWGFLVSSEHRACRRLCSLSAPFCVNRIPHSSH